MTYLYVKVEDEKLEVFLKSLDDMDEVEVIEVKKELTDKEKLVKENHSLRRAWKQG